MPISHLSPGVRRLAWVISHSRCPRNGNYNECTGRGCGWAGECNYGPPTDADYKAAEAIMQLLFKNNFRIMLG